jgi:ligand-binding sensor domain-containing protein
MSPASDAVIALAALLALVASTVDAQPRYRVVSTVGATAEAHDVLALGSRVFVATSGGLVVREGASVRVIGVREGLPGARARSVSHLDGALYVGTLEGLAELDATTLDVKRTFPIRRVRRVLDFGGARYAIGYDGLRRLDQPTRTISLGSTHARERLTDALVVRGVASDGGASDTLWIASAGAGVLRVSPDARVIGRLTARSGLLDDTVHALVRHGDDVLVGTFGGLAVIREGRVVRGHPLARASERLPVRDVRAIAVHDDEVFVATFGAGVHRISGRVQAYEGVHEAFALASSEAGLFVAHREGSARLDGGHLVALADRSLPSADVTALARAFGALYVGTFDRGLVRLRDDGRVESLASQLARWHVDGRVNDLAVTTRGGERLWIATDRGLFWHDGRRFVPVDHARGPGRTHVTSLHVDPRGALWVTSSRVLARWSGEASSAADPADREASSAADPADREASSAADPADPENWEGWGSDALSVTLATGGRDVERFPVQHLHAVHVIADPTDATRDEVWVGSLHGLYRFDPSSARLQRHTVSSGALPVDWVTALATIDGALVAGTYHGGLSWKQGDRFAHETERDGLPAGWVNPHAIVAHGGALHVGALERGLLVGTRGAWRHYTTRDGLPSDDVTAILPERDGIWVGTRGGLVWMERAR